MDKAVGTDPIGAYTRGMESKTRSRLWLAALAAAFLMGAGTAAAEPPATLPGESGITFVSPAEFFRQRYYFIRAGHQHGCFGGAVQSTFRIFSVLSPLLPLH